MDETEEALKLSIIYYALLRDLSDLTGIEFPMKYRNQALQLVIDAVHEACVVKRRCVDCGGTNIVTKCDDCGYMG